jgi:hypothetical protein
MTRTVVMIKGTRYFTTGAAVAILGVSHQTLHRWAKKAGNGHCGILRGLRFFRDPVNGFHYFTAESVENVKHRLDEGRRC